MWGVTAALYSEITFEAGHVRERIAAGFALAQLTDTPELVTDLIEARAEIGGLARSARSVSRRRWPMRCLPRPDDGIERCRSRAPASAPIEADWTRS